MIGWCSVSVQDQIGEAHLSRSNVVHGSSHCHRFKGGTPWQVWVEDDRVWLPPFDRTRPGGRFRWCEVCEPQPALPDWMAYGHCRGADVNLFFPSAEDTVSAQASIAAAKALCAQCGVISECRAWAMMYEGFGVWGGLSAKERERAKLKAKEAKRG